ncbi:uncharacterized protein LOC106416961 [Brassica napus]|uniref:uncharacterized protein LOC106338317 n=1 Tax=Brassica oleracea var. oleracea TaxID=109376 RepID=UPI0006A6DB44|nr:PREDICTED: uncharacterized protein LOC106338317 [Brassica oleracea var. oleracea]XP_013713287.1 uncharacterized protein LOC106416961 [Brassica napus]
MGDITIASDNLKLKYGGRSSINCPMLTSSNYTVWAIRMKLLLKVNKAWEAIETESTSIPEALVLQIGDLDNAKKVWEAIKSRHMGAERVKEARLQTLMSEFEKLKMKDNDTIDSFVGKLSELSSKSAAFWINKTTSFEDIVGRLKAFEERVADEEEDTQDDKSKLMYANTEASQNYQRDFNGNYRGRGRGGRAYGRKGRGRGRSYSNFDMSKITCFRCDKNGHFAADCPDRLLKLQETYENKADEMHEADKLLMHEVVYLNEKNIRPKEFKTNIDGNRLWYLDNGASNHMTGNRKYFNTIDETITGKVRFGDDSRIDIKGKGSILFVSQDGDKKILADVYFILELKSNIISLGQATESGCEVLMKDDVLTLKDKDGNLITSAKRSPNVFIKCLWRW